MRYLGGKSGIAKDIKNAILESLDGDVRGRTYYEPFVGGCGSFDAIAPAFERAVGSDIHPDLMAMWTAVVEGWEPPTEVTSEQYYDAKSLASPNALKGFLGFGGSFGGKWFGGYAKGGQNSDGTPRNHQAESARNVLKTRDRLSRTEVFFRCASYLAVKPEQGDVMYLDPPYTGTTSYATGGWDSGLFWRWAEENARRGVHVFISEYSAPLGWVSVWSKTKQVTVSRGDKARKTETEHLFEWSGR